MIDRIGIIYLTLNILNNVLQCIRIHCVTNYLLDLVFYRIRIKWLHMPNLKLIGLPSRITKKIGSIKFLFLGVGISIKYIIVYYIIVIL